MCYRTIIFFILCFQVILLPLYAQWSESTTISQGTENMGAHVVLDNDGNAFAVWKGAASQSIQNLGIVVASKPMNGTWNSTLDVIPGTGELPYEPHMAIDGEGNFFVLWNERVKVADSDSIVKVSTKPCNSSWQTPVALSDESENCAYSQIAVDGNGNAIAIWESIGRGIQIASKEASGTVWSKSVLTTSSSASRPGIAIDNSGNAIAIWEEKGIQMASKKASESTWTLSTLSSVSGVHEIVMNARGDAAVIASGNGILVFLKKTTDADWTSYALSSSGTYPRIALNNNGDIIAAWQDLSIAAAIAATKRSSEEFWTISTLSNPGMRPGVAIDNNGNVFAVWANRGIYAATKFFGGDWQPEVLISVTTNGLDQPQIVADNNGHATAMWERRGYDPLLYEIQSASYQFIPGVKSLSPLIGPKKGGTSITINGINFAQVSGVRFGEAEALYYTVDSHNQITAIAPPGTGTVHVRVSREAGTSERTSNGLYSYADIPIVAALFPDSGPVQGGTSVEISGSDFISVRQVYFGSSSALQYTVDSPTHITALSPPGNGAVPIKIVTRYGVSSETSAAHYTYHNLADPTAPRHFRGKEKAKKKKLSLKTSWKKNQNPNIVVYEIFARSEKIKTISAQEKARAIIHLHPRHRHHLTKNYRRYLHHKYKIRAVDDTGIVSPFSYVKVKK